MNDSPTARRQYAAPNSGEYHGCTAVSRNVRIDGHRTSIRLEIAMWEALEDIAGREQKTIRELCTMINGRRTNRNLTAAVRLFIISYFRSIVQARVPQLRDNEVPQLRVVAGAAEPNRGFAESAVHSSLVEQALAAIR